MSLVYQEKIAKETTAKIFCRKTPVKIFRRETKDETFCEETTLKCFSCKALYPAEYKNCPSCNMLQ